MTLDTLFWMLYIIAILLGIYLEYVPGQPYPVRRGTGVVLFYALVGILGWKIFGPAIK